MSVWVEQINVKDLWERGDDASPDGPEFETFRDAIVERLKASAWYGRSAQLQELVDDLAETVDNVDDFDFIWSDLYDLADGDRVWIET